MGRGRRHRDGRMFRSVLLFWLLLPSCASASPWAREGGKLFLSTRTDYFTAKADEPLPGAIDVARFERYDSNTYIEFGLGRRFTVGGKVAYGTSTYYDGINASAGAGFSEFEGFAQRELWRNATDVFSVRLTGASTAGLDDGGRPGLVSDGIDGELRVLYGRNVFKRPFKFFAAAEAGYRRRFGDGADQIRADLLIGAEPFKRTLALIELFSTISLRNEDPGGADYDVIKFQPSIAWRMTKRWSVQGGMMKEISGRNLLTGESYFVALWSSF
jgi:hypothetical protein